MDARRTRVFVADDNLIVRQGVKALIEASGDLEVVGEAGDYDSLLAGAEAAAPDVVVTDIRMPPAFDMEGIAAARELRKRLPGLATVVLSQYDEPEYALELLKNGAAGWGYLLKDRVAEGDQLAMAIRLCGSGGSVIDPKVMEQVVNPVKPGNLTPSEEQLLDLISQGRPLKAIAAARRTTPAAVSADVEGLLLKLAREGGAGAEAQLLRLRRLLGEIVALEEQSENLSRMLPGGLADVLRREGRRIGETTKLEVTVLMSDVRGYSGIAERTDPALLARQLNDHRAEMNRAIIDRGGTVMQFAGDAVLAVFGAPIPVDGHAWTAYEAAAAMQGRQAELNARWADGGREPFGLGIGLSTGQVAAALLGSEDRMEYSVVGDVVNMSQRLQQWAGPGEIILSERTHDAIGARVECHPIDPGLVKGRQSEVRAFRVPASAAIGDPL